MVVVGWDGVNPSISSMPHPKEDRIRWGFGVIMKVGLLYTLSAMGGLYDQINDRLILPD